MWLLFVYLNAAQDRRRRAAVSAGRRSRATALPPEPRLQITSATGSAGSSRARNAGARQLRLGRSQRRHRADSHRRGDAAHAAARPSRTAISLDAVRSDRTTRTPLCHGSQRAVACARRLRRVRDVPRLFCAERPGADHRRADPRVSQAPGASASSVPAPLREIGFDQNLDRPVPLDLPVSGRGRSARPARQFFGSEAGRARVRLLRLSDALHAGAHRDDEHAADCCRSSPAGISRSSRSVSTRVRHPRIAAAKKAEYVARYGRPAAEDGLAFPDRRTTRRSVRVHGPPAFDTPGTSRPSSSPTRGHHRRSRRTAVRPGTCSASSTARAICGSRSSKRPGPIGSAVDALLLYCYHYDPMTGRYGLVIMRLLRIAGLAHRPRARRLHHHRRQTRTPTSSHEHRVNPLNPSHLLNLLHPLNLLNP